MVQGCHLWWNSKKDMQRKFENMLADPIIGVIKAPIQTILLCYDFMSALKDVILVWGFTQLHILQTSWGLGFRVLPDLCFASQWKRKNLFLIFQDLRQVVPIRACHSEPNPSSCSLGFDDLPICIPALSNSTWKPSSPCYNFILHILNLPLFKLLHNLMLSSTNPYIHWLSTQSYHNFNSLRDKNTRILSLSFSFESTWKPSRDDLWESPTSAIHIQLYYIINTLKRTYTQFS